MIDMKLRNTDPRFKQQFLADRTKFATHLDGRHFPKSFIILRYMIDGERGNWSIPQISGGGGTVSVNCEGGFGIDAAVRRMIKEALVTYHRHEYRGPASRKDEIPRCPVSLSYLKVTDKGRKKYELIKKRLSKHN